MSKMIYHVPYPLNFQATSGSGIRPVKMYQAFQDAGFEVFLVSGYAPERRQRIKEVKRLIRQGEKFAFLYSESATIPTALTEPKHLPPHLFLDFSFFRFCQKHGINGGVFYRDIYWLFPIYEKLVSKPIATLMRLIYRWDLHNYKRTLTKVFIPSKQMGKHIPIIPQQMFAPLPPGCIENQTSLPSDNLNLLYVGGLGEHYRIKKLLTAVANTKGVELVICVPEAVWAHSKEEYLPFIAENIKIVHVFGEELEKWFAWANVGCIVVEPDEYWQFAVPIKLLDYIGHGLPVLASTTTWASNFIEENNCGWTVDYSDDAIQSTLENLSELGWLDSMKERVNTTAQLNTWKARAIEVAQLLGKEKNE